MKFELMLIAGLMIISFFLIVLPLCKFYRALAPVKRDALKEAKMRLDVAKAEAEAAVLNKETEKLYEEIYSEVLEDSDSKRQKL